MTEDASGIRGPNNQQRVTENRGAPPAPSYRIRCLSSHTRKAARSRRFVRASEPARGPGLGSSLSLGVLGLPLRFDPTDRRAPLLLRWAPFFEPADFVFLRASAESASGGETSDPSSKRLFGSTRYPDAGSSSIFTRKFSFFAGVGPVYETNPCPPITKNE